MRKRQEEILQRTLWGLYLQYGCPYVIGWHTPNGGKRGIKEAVSFQAMGVVSGVPDLTFIKPVSQLSKVVMLELKSAKGKQSTEQTEFKHHAIQAGCVWLTSKTLGECIEYLIEHGIMNAAARNHYGTITQ